MGMKIASHWNFLLLLKNVISYKKIFLGIFNHLFNYQEGEM